MGALGDGLGREVVDHEGVGLGTGGTEGAGAVVLAVVAGEHGDDHARAGDLGAAVHVDILGAEVDGLDLGGLAGAAVGEDALDAALPGLLELGELDDLGAGVDDIALDGGAQGLDDNAVGDLGQLGVLGELDDKTAVERGEEALHVYILGKLDTDLVTDAHLKEALGAAAVAGRGYGQGVAGSSERLDGVKRGEQLLGVGTVVLAIGGGGDADDAVREALELGRDGAGGLAHGDGEADQGRRNVELAGLVLKRTAHGVLAADGAGTQVDLGHEGAQDGCRGLAPALGLGAQTLEVLLEGEIGALVLKAGSHELGDGLDHGQVGARKLVGLHQIGVEAPCHGTRRGGLAAHGELGDHGRAGGELRLAAKGHEHGRGADGGVEALGKALVGSDVEVGDERGHALGERGAGPAGLPHATGAHVGDLVLGCAVGVEELAGQVDDSDAVPGHAHARLSGNLGDNGRLQVLLGGVAHELLDVTVGDGAGHALLGLRDSELGAVQAVVLLGHGVQVDIQAVGKLAHGDRDAAGAKVVAALDQTAGVAAAEQTLQLALDRGVALLDLGTRGLDGLGVLGLGGAGGATDAIAAGAAAQQDDLVGGGGALATNVVCRGSAHDGANLHALGHVTGVIEFVDLTGGKADLVAVAGVAGGGSGHELALRQLALERLGNRDGGVTGAGDTHGLVHVAAARERVADGAAHAGGGTAEGLDLGRVVVGLVLKQEQPVLVLAVDIDLHLDGAGVDLLGLVDIGHDAGLLKVLGADGAHVHEADGLGVAAEFVAHLHVAVEGLLHHGVVDRHVVQDGAEGGVAAVVGPVGVDHADLGDGGVAVLIAEVLLAEGDVCLVHGKAAIGDKGGKAGLVELAEAVEHLDGLGLGSLHVQRLGQVERGDARLDGVHHVVLDGIDGGLVQSARDHIDLGGAHSGALALADELHALAGGVGALVKLARQEFDGKDGAIACGEFVVGHIDLGLAKDGRHAGAEKLLVDALDVVAVDDPQGLDALDAENFGQLALELLSLDVEPGFLLHVDTRDHWFLPS